MYVRPFLVMLYIMPITLSFVAVSVWNTFPSPRRVTVSLSTLMILWMRWLPYVSLTRATVPFLRSSSFHGPRVIWSRRCTMKGFMLFPFTVMFTVLPCEISCRISSINMAFCISIVLDIFSVVPPLVGASLQKY